MADLDNEKPLKKIGEAFKDLAAIVNSQTGDVEVAPFSRACSLVLPLIGCLGFVFKFVEINYVAKVDGLAEASKSIVTLQALIDRDMEANCVRRMDSNSDHLLKVNRALDLVKVLFEQILATPTEVNSVKDPLSTAYEKVFAPYHGYAIRKAVAAGMYALPTKAQLLKKLHEEDEASARIHMQDYVASSAPVILYVDNLFLSRGLGVDW